MRRADFLLVESPPLFLGWTAWFLSRLKRAAMIFNVSDLYPETAVSLGYLRKGRALDALYALEAWCYKRSTLVTGQTEGIVDDIRRRFPEKQVHLLTNGVDVSDFSFTAAPHGGPFTIGYAGILGHAQALPSALEAVRLLKQRGVPVRFAFYGDGPLREDLERQAREHGLDNVRFAGHCTRREVLDGMRGWDAGLVPLVDSPTMAGALPSKMFEVMAASLPVVLSAPAGEALRLITRANAGVHAPAENPEALANAIAGLVARRDEARAMGQNARAYVFAHYDRARIAESFVAKLVNR